MANENIEKELTTKLKEYIEGKLSLSNLYNWGMEQIFENNDEKVTSQNKKIINDLFGDIVELNEPKWSRWTNQKAQYYYDCLIGKEKYNYEKANQLGKRIDI